MELKGFYYIRLPVYPDKVVNSIQRSLDYYANHH